MSFTLRKIRNSQLVTFSTRDLLELLGDRINDVIHIRGERYRISSIIGEIGGTTAAENNNTPSNISWQADWTKISLQVNSSGQSVFPIQIEALDPEGLFLVVNGALFDYGTESAFHIQNGQLFWHGGFNLEIQDRIYIKYLLLTHN